MTTPTRPDTWSAPGLRRLATAFVGQEHVGILGGLLLRLARYLQGDPSLPFAVTASNGQIQQLPDNVPALSAVFVVTGQPINFRMDGQSPTGNDGLLFQGTVVTLTGQASIKGFRFTTNTVFPATLNGSFYD